MSNVNEAIMENLKSGNSVKDAAKWAVLVKQRERENFTQAWQETKSRLQKAGCAFLNLEKTRDNYKNGTVTYQNIKCEYWTAAIVKGQLSDVMIKAKDENEARANQIRWESFLN